MVGEGEREEEDADGSGKTLGAVRSITTVGEDAGGEGVGFLVDFDVGGGEGEGEVCFLDCLGNGGIGEGVEALLDFGVWVSVEALVGFFWEGGGGVGDEGGTAGVGVCFVE